MTIWFEAAPALTSALLPMTTLLQPVVTVPAEPRPTATLLLPVVTADKEE